MSGGWGHLGDADRQANEDTLKHGDWLVPKYELAPDTELLVIPEFACSATTVPHAGGVLTDCTRNAGSLHEATQVSMYFCPGLLFPTASAIRGCASMGRG